MIGLKNWYDLLIVKPRTLLVCWQLLILQRVCSLLTLLYNAQYLVGCAVHSTLRNAGNSRLASKPKVTVDMESLKANQSEMDPGCCIVQSEKVKAFQV